jgi:hypothetical protein
MAVLVHFINSSIHIPTVVAVARRVINFDEQCSLPHRDPVKMPEAACIAISVITGKFF